MCGCTKRIKRTFLKRKKVAIFKNAREGGVKGRGVTRDA